MKRRDFLKNAVVGAAAAAGAGVAGCAGSGEVQFAATGDEPAPAGGAASSAHKKVVWRLTSSFPRSLDTLAGPRGRRARPSEAWRPGARAKPGGAGPRSRRTVFFWGGGRRSTRSGSAQRLTVL